MKHLHNQKQSEWKENRLLFESAFNVEGDFGQIEDQKETKEDQKKPEENKDIVLEIEAQKSIINEKAGEILRSLPEAQRELAKEFFEPFLEKTQKQYDKITTKFLAAKEKIGTATWENSDERWSIVNEAKELTTKILEQDLDKPEVIKAIQKSLLDDLPNPENKNEEKKLVNEWIQNSDELREHYGVKSDYLDDVLDLVTKRYDIRMKEGQIVYAQDLITGKTMNGIDFKKQVLENLKPGGKYEPNQLKAERQATRKTLKRIARIRKEIEKGTIFAMGGRINEWEDFDNHKGLEELKAMVDQKEIKKFYEDFEIMQKQAEYVNDFNDLVEKADLKGRVKGAEKAGFKAIEGERKKVEVSKLDFTAKEVLKNENGDRITIEIDAQKRILLTVESSDKSVKIEKSFSNPEDFSQLDLAKTAEAQIQNYRKNQAELNRRTEVLHAQIPKESGLNVLIPLYSNDQLASENFAFKSDSLVLSNYIVGEIQFLDGENIELKVRGESPIQVSESELGQKVIELKTQLEAVREKGEKVKEEMETQWQSDDEKLNLPKEYKLAEAGNFEGDFTDPNGQTKLRKVLNAEGKVVGEIYMKNNQGAEGGHGYQFEHQGEWEDLDNIEAVGKYINENQEALEPKETIEVEFTGSTEIIAMKNRVLEKMVQKMEKKQAVLLQTLSGLGGQINPEQFKKEMQGSFKLIVEATPESALKRMDESDDPKDWKLTKEESKQFMENMIEDIKGNIEEPDESEMKIIGDLEVEIKGETKTFREVFGEDLVRLLSMQEAVKLEGETLMIKRRGEYSATNVEGLINQLPKNLKKKCQSILEGEEFNQEELKNEALKQIEKAKKRGSIKELMKLSEELGSTENFGGQMAWQKILFIIFEWIKSGDLSVALDAMKAFNNEGLSNGFNEARNEYQQGVNNASLRELLAFRNNPTGPEANARFKNDLFRKDLEGLSETRILNVLGVESDELISWSKNNVLIFKKEGVEYELKLVTGGNANDKAELRQRAPNSESSAKTYDINDGLTGAGNTLENIFGKPPLVQEKRNTENQIKEIDHNAVIPKMTKKAYEIIMTKQDAKEILNGNENEFLMKFFTRLGHETDLIAREYGALRRNEEGSYEKMDEIVEKIIKKESFMKGLLKTAYDKVNG